jgi:site-specific recombinase XerD
MTELEAFCAHFRLLGNSEHTLENYLGALKRLETMLGHSSETKRELGSATPLDLRSYLAERSTQVQAATLAGDVRALRCFYRWRAEALSAENPALSLKLPKIPEPVTESCSRESYLKLLAAIPSSGFMNARDRALITVLWSSGARLSEVARMRREDLDLAAGTFVIPRAKSRRPRTVGLTPEAVKALKQYLKFSKLHTPALWWGTQGPLSDEGIKQMLQRRSKAAGVNVSAHMFRRGVAERWLAAGGSETLLRYHAGWESHLMVRRYIRANGERLAIDEHRRLLG